MIVAVTVFAAVVVALGVAIAVKGGDIIVKFGNSETVD